MPELTGLDHLVLTVADLKATARFYCDVLGMQLEEFEVSDGTKRLALKFGQQKINLHQAGAEFLPNARNATPGSADLCFVSQSPLGDWQAKLLGLNIQIEAGNVARSGAMGRITSIYLRDPDGNLIEISVYD